MTERTCAAQTNRLPPRQKAQAESAAGESETVVAKTGNEAPVANEDPTGNATEQFDDLLFPTGSENAVQPEVAEAVPNEDSIAPAVAQPNPDTTAALTTQTQAQPLTGIESDVEPENWAEYGGWYRQDYTIYYRPTGHKDKFIHSWLALTGPQAPKGGTGPAVAVFDYLTSKDAQGSCTKCHSVDDIRGKSRAIGASCLCPEQAGTLHELNP